MHFYTYKITNLLNGKIYIGVHKTSNLDDGYMGSGKNLKRSFQKYGINNFKKDILMFHESEDEMFEIESLIVDNDFVKRPDTYNIKLGGFGGWDHIKRSTEEHSLIVSKAGKSLAKKRQVNKGFDNEYKINLSNGIKLAWSTGKFNGKMDHLKTIWIDRKHKSETINKLKSTLKQIEHQKGEKNSQFGKMWIYSETEKKSVRINKNEPIPNGWNKGRRMFK